MHKRGACAVLDADEFVASARMLESFDRSGIVHWLVVAPTPMEALLGVNHEEIFHGRP